MKITEQDCRMALSIAKILGVDELEPWQEFMLQHMLAGHRQGPPEVRRGPYSLCDSVHPQSTGPIKCVRAAGHPSRHESSPNPGTGHSFTWL